MLIDDYKDNENNLYIKNLKSWTKMWDSWTLKKEIKWSLKKLINK